MLTSFGNCYQLLLNSIAVDYILPLKLIFSDLRSENGSEDQKKRLSQDGVPSMKGLLPAELEWENYLIAFFSSQSPMTRTYGY